MKKSPPKNQPVLPEKAPKKIPALKLNSTNQVILAAIVVLLIFIVAVMSSTPRQSQQTPGSQQQGVTAGQTTGEGTMSGQQVARISITRSDSQQGQDSEQVAGSITTGVLADLSTEQLVAKPAGTRFKFKIDTFKKLAVQPLKFNIYDEYGKELTPELLRTVHELKLHMIVVSANLREWTRVIPEYSNGIWNANVNLPNQGTYYAYIKISPIKGNEEILRSVLTVREASKGTPDYPGLTPNNLAIAGDVSAVLNLTDAGLGNISTMMFSLTRNGKNVDDVRPYLGAFGHVMYINHADMMVCADTTFLPVIDESKGIFEFATKFFKAGRYTAFAEFKVGEKVLLFPITFDVQ